MLCIITSLISKALPPCSYQNCETGTLQSRALPDLFGNRGSKFLGNVGLLGFTDNADIIGDIPHTAATCSYQWFSFQKVFGT